MLSLVSFLVHFVFFLHHISINSITISHILFSLRVTFLHFFLHPISPQITLLPSSSFPQKPFLFFPVPNLNPATKHNSILHPIFKSFRRFMLFKFMSFSNFIFYLTSGVV
ncbi:hypothetical protein RIF29_39452 [Crotalaria pallida]|uniref:Uncharacterized protein n=1 Tax=Crotalaria pallida TaxID=3830 RepID=A0AAN9E7J2_CROPI